MTASVNTRPAAGRFEPALEVAPEVIVGVGRFVRVDVRMEAHAS